MSFNEPPPDDVLDALRDLSTGVKGIAATLRRYATKNPTKGNWIAVEELECASRDIWSAAGALGYDKLKAVKDD